MGENRAGWTMHRISWERRGHQDADCYSPWSDQRRAFADNRRARLRAKRAERVYLPLARHLFVGPRHKPKGRP